MFAPQASLNLDKPNRSHAMKGLTSPTLLYYGDKGLSIILSAKSPALPSSASAYFDI